MLAVSVCLVAWQRAEGWEGLLVEEAKEGEKKKSPSAPVALLHHLYRRR